MQKILLTGGTGYIGSHTCVVLMQAGYDVVIVDNLSNSQRSVVDRIARIVGRRPDFIEGDVRDKPLLSGLFRQHQIGAAIHFAGLKAVGESMADPLRYYHCNVAGTVTLCEAMADTGVKTLIFSSSATVYGDNAPVPYTENLPLGASNVYGRSKQMVEEILADVYRSDDAWRIARLRYFNPVAAHESGLIGEAPSGVPNNLMPFIAQVATGKRERLNVYGGDYPTRDGTGVRDFIHVADLAEGHLAAMKYLERERTLLTVNLGTGNGCSVLEMVQAFARASGRPIPYVIVDRRPGDLAEYWADSSEAARLLGWRATRGIDAMCEDTWRWQQNADSL